MFYLNSLPRPSQGLFRSSFQGFEAKKFHAIAVSVAHEHRIALSDLALDVLKHLHRQDMKTTLHPDHLQAFCMAFTAQRRQ